MNYIVHTDGGARGNPGPSAIGVFVQSCTCSDMRHCAEREKTTIASIGKTTGEGTNNVAEYAAVVEALRFLANHIQTHKEGVTDVAFYLDSTLVVNQLNGIFKVKDPTLRGLLTVAHTLEGEVGGRITYAYVPREQNYEADALVNKALDEAGY